MKKTILIIGKILDVLYYIGVVMLLLSNIVFWKGQKNQYSAHFGPGFLFVSYYFAC